MMSTVARGQDRKLVAEAVRQTSTVWPAPPPLPTRADASFDDAVRLAVDRRLAELGIEESRPTRRIDFSKAAAEKPAAATPAQPRYMLVDLPSEKPTEPTEPLRFIVGKSANE
jgi:hypothetical protein